ncbi:MAG TPA: hypothetical protein VKK31_29690 [Thermoanaerobaculia bacterium]|nr:hypothetical protein [Thermoanaerobaculia bacterium]
MRAFAAKSAASSGAATASLSRFGLFSGNGENRTAQRIHAGESRAGQSFRFAHDFSQIPLHTGGRGESRPALTINTPGDEYEREADRVAAQVLGMPEVQPDSPSHELARVVHRDRSTEAAKTVRRSVGPSSKCPANVHDAPADPLARLETIDSLAQLMALGSSNVLFLESLTFRDPTFGPSYVSDAYRKWFGAPEQASAGKWKSRFKAATFATEKDAAAHEMGELAERFGKLHQWLASDIRYVCPGTGPSKIPGCAPKSCTTEAWSCPGARAISICPKFWAVKKDDGLASLLVHESVHTGLRFRQHSMADARGRGSNSACYQGFVDEIYKTGSRPLSSQCTPI